MALTKTSNAPRAAEPTAPDTEVAQTGDDAEIAALRAQLAEAQQKIVAMESTPSTRSRGSNVPDGFERVVPQGDFDLHYGGAKYKFVGGQPVVVPQEVANHLKAVRLQDSQTQAPIKFDGNSLFRSTNE